MPETIAVPAVGSPMTDIPLTDAAGAESRLSDEIAGAPSVVFFMRAADCPICIGHALTLSRMAAAGELRGARVIVIAPRGADDARKARARIPSAAVAIRASGEHHADLGLGKFLTLQHSGTFVVDASGRLRSAVTSPLPPASFSKAKVLAALAG